MTSVGKGPWRGVMDDECLVYVGTRRAALWQGSREQTAELSDVTGSGGVAGRTYLRSPIIISAICKPAASNIA
jgi:hypothetical protein